MSHGVDGKRVAGPNPTIFTFGINAVARNLRRSTITNKNQNNQDPPMQTLVLIARHTSSLLIRHLPFLAVVLMVFLQTLLLYIQTIR